MAGELRYRDAGVDIGAGAEFVSRIRGHVERTQGRRKLLGAFGLFAAAYDLSGYAEPVIVTGCDGVGTKMELLLEHGLLETAGKDLVAMSVNDILTTGGDPVLFLDYLGVCRLDGLALEPLVKGMADYLEACDCILAGGETAEMPGLVPEGVIEVSGFCIGVAEKASLLDPARIEPGDVLLGFASDGFHANGWSLVRRVLRERSGEFSAAEVCELLAPTRLYADTVKGVRAAGVDVRAMAHITGGGVPENVGRLLPEGCVARVRLPRWENELVERVLCSVDAQDRYETFNMGIGWVVIVPEAEAAGVLAAGLGAVEIGVIEAGDGGEAGGGVVIEPEEQGR